MLLSTPGHTIVNGGMLEGAAGVYGGVGGLIIESSTVNQTTGGTIFAGNGSSVSLQSADVIGGFLNTSGSGVITVNADGSTLDGSTSVLTNEGALTVADNSSLTVKGTIDNTGVITLASTGDATDLTIAGGALALTGDGSVVMEDGGAIDGFPGAATLTNDGNTISGQGQILATNITLINKAGTIDGNGSQATTLNTGADTITNAGTIESQGPAAWSSPVPSTTPACSAPPAAI